MRASTLLMMLASAVWPCVASAGSAPGQEPRPISAAERSAVELAADFAVRGPEAIWERLDPTAPLHALGHDAALLEISARLGSRAGVTWTLETPSTTYGESAALFHLGFPSGVEDLLRIEFATPGGGRVRHLWTLIDHPEASRGPGTLATSARDRFQDRFQAERSAARAAASLLVAVLLAGFGLATLSARAPTRRRARLALGALLLAACSPEADAPVRSVVVPFAPRVGQLSPLRLALTGGRGAANATGAVTAAGTRAATSGSAAAARIEQLWHAETALVQGDLSSVDALLGASRPETDPPLAMLLRARATAARFRAAAVGAYDEVALAGFESDQLRLEQIAVSSLLDGANPESAAVALRSGSRLAELWYVAAAEAAAQEKGEVAEARLRTAWSLRPLPRDEIFSEPALAALAARPALFPLFELGSPAEPVVRVPGSRTPLVLPAGALGRLCGRHYSIRLGAFDLELPGGVELAPLDTPVQNAATFRAEVEQRALATLATLPAVAVSASPLRTRLTEVAARALAREGKWAELLALTGGEQATAVEASSELLIRMRALGLRQVGRGPEAVTELVRLAQRALAGRRPFPGALYDLAELLAAEGRYDTAIRLVRKADAQVSQPFGEARLRQFGLSLELERTVQEHRSAHFSVRFPAAGGDRFGRQIATVLEEERLRLLQWIPQPGRDRVVVELLPLQSFLAAYAGEVPVLGLFDGRVRVPLADIQSLDPSWIAIISHELTHALLAGATRGRAPHWLQEGLAQHAEMGSLEINPLPALEAAGRTLSFPALEPILHGFAEPQLVELAYSESAWVVSYIESRGGREALRALVTAYAGGASTERAIAAVLGTDLESFDHAFREWAVRRAPAKRLIAARRFDRELEGPFAAETREADLGRRQVAGMRVDTASAERHPSESRTAAMQAWHARYRAATAEVRRIYAPVEKIYRARQGSPASEDCAGLRLGAAGLVRDHADALGAPEILLATELRRAYEELAALGESCEQGRSFEAFDHFSQAVQSFGRAAELLRPFGLAP